MSKSLGNHIGVGEPPQEIYGKTLSLPDAAMAGWYELLLGEPRARRAVGARRQARARRAGSSSASGRPTTRRAAAEHFDRVFVQHALPDEIEEARFDGSAGGRSTCRR